MRALVIFSGGKKPQKKNSLARKQLQESIAEETHEPRGWSSGEMTHHDFPLMVGWPVRVNLVDPEITSLILVTVGVAKLPIGPGGKFYRKPSANVHWRLEWRQKDWSPRGTKCKDNCNFLLSCFVHFSSGTIFPTEERGDDTMVCGNDLEEDGRRSWPGSDQVKRGGGSLKWLTFKERNLKRIHPNG